MCGKERWKKGMTVSRDDRDVSFALVISGCLGTARGQRESSGVTGQTTLPALKGGVV